MTGLILAALLGGIWLGVSAFAAAQDEGSESKPAPEPRPPLRVLTWNVLAPSAGERLLGWLGGDGAAARAGALLREAQGLNPDILAFQEVTAELLDALAADPAGTSYHASARGPHAPPGGLLVLSRHPFSKVVYRKLPSASGRNALFATLDIGGEALVMATVHLESLPEDRAAREAQLAFVSERLPGRGLTLWLGDLNLGNQDPEAARLAGWTDAWPRLRPGEAGHTYDLEGNPLAREHAFAAEPSRRLDRILTPPRLTPVAVGLAGRGLPDPPSDHYGLWADLVPIPP